MSQLPPDFAAYDDYDDPFIPLGEEPDESPDFETHLRRMEMIESALALTGDGDEEDDTLPSYYDDLLMRLIDSIPLE